MADRLHSPMAYIFDMDGVIVDNTRHHVLAWVEFARRHGGHITEQNVVDWMGETGATYIRRIIGCELTADEIRALAEEKEAVYREIMAPELVAREGLVDFLEGAAGAGIPCGIATGGPRENVDFVLDGLGIRKFFKCVVDSSQYEHGKPAPDCYLKAASEIGCAPAGCIVFEDALKGIKSAKAAGMRVLAITGTNDAATLRAAEPYRVIDSFVEVLGLNEGQSAAP